MIVKGKLRSGPEQLAAYLMRNDDGERATLLELQYGEDDLRQALIDWDSVGRYGTRSEKTLYHAQIAWEAKYDLDTPQCLRAVQILAEDLGMATHPRAVVLHDGGDKPHLHVVFMRTDTDTMTMWEDYQNYIKHERASLRMEKEFGHEFIPGKHAKRDRKKQKDFPRSKLNQDEAQYEERSGLSKEARLKEIRALHAASDNGLAFKAALEDAGYLLAKGDRGYIVVDQKGGHSVLSRNVGLKKKEIDAFMAGVKLEKLPAIDEAKAIQAERRKKAKADKKGVEQSKFLKGQEPSTAPEPAPAPQDAALEAKKKALAEREAAELKKLAEYHAHQQRQLEFELNKEMADKLAVRAADELQAINDLKAAIRERQTGIKGLVQAIENRWNPQLGAERAKERRREIAQLKRRQAKERADYEALLEQVRHEQVENLKMRQAQQMHDQRQRHIEESERYTREHEQAKKLAADIKAEQEELKRNESLRDGPPPPKLGK